MTMNGTNHTRAVVAALTLVLASACGGRTIGMPGRDGGGTGWDADPYSDARPGVDGAPPIGSCTAPAEQVVILDAIEPCFVHTLDRTNTGKYVLGASKGWQDPGASLWVLDGETLERDSQVPVPGRSVHAQFDQWASQVVASTDEDNGVWFYRYDLVAGLNPVQRDAVFLCDQCTPSWAGPIPHETCTGVAVRDLWDNQLRVYVMSRDAVGEVYVTEGIQGSSPQLAYRSEDLVLVYLHDSQLWEQRIDAYADFVGPPRLLSEEPIQGLLTAAAYADQFVVAAVLVGASDAPRLKIIKWTGFAVTTQVEVGNAVDVSVEASFSFGSGAMGLGWGQTYGDGQVGAHFLGLNDLLQPIFGPSLISAPVNQASASYTVWAATSQHPTGHAVVWGAWHEDTNYGLYGKIIQCIGGYQEP